MFILIVIISQYLGEGGAKRNAGQKEIFVLFFMKIINWDNFEIIFILLIFYITRKKNFINALL